MKILRSKAKTKPSAKPSTKPHAESSTKPSIKPTAKPNSKSYAKLSMKSSTKPTTKPSIKLNTKSNARPSSKVSAKPSYKLNTKLSLTVSDSSKSKSNTKPISKPRTEKQTTLTVNENNELLKFLLAQLPQKGRNYMKSLLAHRQISVDGEITTLYNYSLVVGQKVLVNWTKVFDRSQPRGLKILSEDEHIIVIEKPAGMLSIATDQEKELTAYNILSDHVKRRDPNQRIFVVHRLDRDTSGVMMFAKREEIKKSLQNDWKDVVLERSYAVVVEGSVVKDKGTIISWLKESKALRMYSSSIPNDGQKAVTHYQVLEKNSSYSLLKVKLETGRKNQIRVHMQDLGHSVIGDIKYGGTKSPINRLGLHADILAFKHPITGENVYFESPIPKQFLSLFNK